MKVERGVSVMAAVRLTESHTGKLEEPLYAGSQKDQLIYKY